MEVPQSAPSILVVGASGATGRRLVAHLLERGACVRVVVRAQTELPEQWQAHPNLSVTRADLLALSDSELAQLVRGCGAVASCLGHTLSWRGVYGAPRRLVTEATRRLCQAIEAQVPELPVKFVLMNSSGCRNRDLGERISWPQSMVILLLRCLLPPHADNEQALEYLRTGIGARHRSLEWVAVRPDGLIDAAQVTAYEAHPSPLRSAIFDAGKTSRTNVGHFMAQLITDEGTWQQWKHQMPVVYNVD